MIGKKINQLATELAPLPTDLTIIGDPTTGVSKKITLEQISSLFGGSVSFYTNLASFPAVGNIDIIYCAKDTNKLYLWGGSSYVEVFPSQSLLNTYQLRSEKGNANGYASLDSLGKVPISQLPSSLMEYKGTWNAATNTPTLANGTGDTGDVYICNVAGTVNFGAGPITFAVGDYVIYSGSIWQRSSGAVGTVTSVGVTRSGDALAITGSPITTSGTINLGFAGNSTQYINGAGNLVTFPGIINEAQNLITEVYNKTGATLTKGTVVYINGGQGNLPAVTKALATGDSTSAQTYGIVRNDITNNNNGYVVVAGRISDLDTQAYTEGTQLYLSPTTAGTFTSTKPYAPNHLVYVGIVVRAHPTQGVVEVKIQNGYELDELHNVSAQSPTNNDGIFYNSATSLWEKKSIATVLGYTPQPQLSGTGFVKISGTTISYDNSTYLTTSAAASTYLPLILNGSANTVDINGQQFTIQGSAGGFTSGRIIVDPVFSAIGYQNAGVFDGLKILTNGNAEFTNSGVTRFFNQVRFDSTLTNGTYTYTLPGATGTIALVGGAGVGTVTSVGLSSATSGVTIGSTPITTSGTITLAIATASGSQQGLLSSTDWTTFNNKQNALTNPVTGTGTTNYLPKFTGTSTIGNSQVFDNGTQLAINTATPSGFGTQRFLVVSSAASQVARFTDGANGDLVFDFPSATISRITAQYGTGGVLVFANGTGFAEQMRLNASGNLSIGNTNDTYKLDVSGASRILASTYTSGAILYLRDAAATGSNTTFGGLFLGSSPGTDFVLGKQSTNAVGSFAIKTGGGTTLFTLADTGAATFSSNLTVQGSGSFTWGISSTAVAKIGASGTGGSLLVMTPSLNSSYESGFAVDGTYSGGKSEINLSAFGVYSGGPYSADMVFKTSTNTTLSEKMRITNAGNVGIGTTNPSYPLQVRRAGGGGSLGISIDGVGSTDRTVQYFAIQDSASGAGAGHAFYYRPASSTTDTLGLLLNEDGNVGIGTTSPSNKLTISANDVFNQDSSGQLVIRGATTPAKSLLIGFDTTSNYGYLQSIEQGTSTRPLVFQPFGGNVGIGMTTPNAKLEVTSGVPVSAEVQRWSYNNGNADFSLRLRQDVSSGLVKHVFDVVNNATTYSNNLVLTNGNVGIGTTSPVRTLDVRGSGMFNGNLQLDIGELNVPKTLIFNANSTTGGSYGDIKWYNVQWDGNTRGEIVVEGDGALANGRMVFKTGSSGSNATERMRITSGGELCVGTASTTNGAIINFYKASGTITTISGGTTSAQNHIVFANPNGNVGSIQVSGSTTSYNIMSDYRLKQDYKDFNGLDLVNKINIYDFQWKSDKSRMYGAIAHELQSVINYAVFGEKDGKEMQGVDYSKIVPVLIKAIQEQQKQIEQLKNK